MRGRDAKVTVVLFYIAVLVVLGFVVPRIYADFDEGLFRYFLVVYFPIALIYGIVYYYVRKNLASAMEKVKGACEQHSTSRVCYRLKSEHWGGCNKVRQTREIGNYNIDDSLCSYF